MISYILGGDATLPIGEGQRLIVHVCNTRRGWGAGFVLAVSKRWSEPESAYRNWPDDTFKLGEVQFVQVESTLTVCNMLAQEGYGSGNRNPHSSANDNSRPPIRYQALERCLTKASEWASQHDASVHMPRIGASLAGGRWSEIEPIILRTMKNIPVHVYDFPGGHYNP